MAQPSMVIRIAANVAELKKNLAEGKVQIETTTAAMSKLANSLSGAPLFQAAMNITAAVNAAGGATKLTRAEMDRHNVTLEKALDKYRALGQEAPAAMVALANATKKIPPELNNAVSASEKLSSTIGDGSGGLVGKLKGLLGAAGIGVLTGAGLVAALGAGVKSALAYADSLTKLSDKTGIGVVALQRLGAVAAASGNDIEQISASVNAFQKRLVEESGTTSAALGRINVSVAQLRDLSPDEQFFSIARGVAAIKDPAEQTRTAMDLFGKAGAEILPTLKADIDKLKDSTFTMSADSVKALDDFGDTMTAFGTSAVNVLGEVAGAAVKAASAIVNMAGSLPTPGGAAPGTQLPGSNLITLDAAKEKVQAFTGAITFMGNVVKASTVGIVQGFQYGADAVDDMHAAFKQFADDGAAKAVVELAKFEQNVRDVVLTSQGYAVVIDTIDAATVESIMHYREQGVEMKALGEMYGLTSVQVKALTEAETAEAAMLAALTRGNENLAKAMSARNQIRKSVEVLDEPRGRTSIGTLTGGVNPQLESIRNSFTVRAKEFSQQFGAVLQTALPQNIMAAVTGGGSVMKAAGSTLGSFLMSPQGIGETLTKGLTSALGAGLGGAVSTLLPGIGALVGPLTEKLFSVLKGIGGPSKLEQAGRAVAADFQKQFGSAEEMINRVGDAYRANGKTAEEAQAAIQAMWAAEKLGAEATRAAVAAIAEEIKRQGEMASAISAQGFKSQDELTHAADIANAAYKQMLASGQYTAAQVEQAYRNYQEQLSKLEGVAGEAARAWLEAHKAADGAIVASSKAMQSAEADLKGLIDKRNSLIQGIAAESPEEVMGVIEAQQRGQLAVLDDEIQRKADAYAKLADETGQRMADAIVEALRNIKIEPVYVPVVVGNATVPVIPQADGGDWMVTKPTLFLAGEAGPERATFTPQGKGRSGGRADAEPSISMGALVAEFAMLRSDLNTRLPVAIGFAVRDQVALLRGRR